MIEIINDVFKIIYSNKDVDIVAEIKDIPIENDTIKREILKTLNVKVDELAKDMKCFKDASKMEGDQPIALSLMGIIVTTANINALKVKQETLKELLK